MSTYYSNRDNNYSNFPNGPRRVIRASVVAARNNATNRAIRGVEVNAPGLNSGRSYALVGSGGGLSKSSSRATRSSYIRRRMGEAKLTYLAAGSTGLAFSARGSILLSKAWQRFLGGASNVVRGAPLPITGASLVVKVTFKPDGESMRDHIQLAVKEARVHATIVSKKGSLGRETIAGRDLLPAFYGAGMDMRSGAYIILMGAAEGKSLDATLASQHNTLTAAQFCAVDLAFQRLWALGFCHSDSHGGNIFLTKDGKCTFIDMGHALAMPPRLREIMKQQMMRRPDVLAAGLFDIYQAKVNSVMKGRGYSEWINSDGTMLLYLLKLVPESRLAEISRLKMRRFSVANRPS